MAKLYTYFTHSEYGNMEHRFDQIFVIDVLRATTTMAVALENGADKIYPVAGKEEAVNLQRRLAKNSSNDIILAGERKGQKITGFDLGNSPFEYMNSGINGKSIVMTTSNGTQALHKCKDVAHIWVMSNLNLRSTSRKVLQGKNTAVLCAGSHLEASIEDTLCAGLFINLVRYDAAWEMNDQSLMAAALAQCQLGHYPPNSVDYFQRIKDGIHSQRLFGLGAEKDVKFSCHFDIYDSAVKYDGESVYSVR